MERYYYIGFVNGQNPRVSYASRPGLYTDKSEAQAWADKWNEEHYFTDERVAVVLEK